MGPGFTSRVTASVLGVGFAAAACRDTAKPGPSEVTSTPVGVTYLCGNEFLLQNQNSQSIIVHYAVLGTDEDGELTLPGNQEGGATDTRLITLNAGQLEVSGDNEWVTRMDNGGRSCPPPAAADPRASVGEWTAPFPWPVVAVHLHLLPDGRVFSWGRIGAPQIYNPADGSFTEAPTSTMVFCGGHTFLADGRLLVTGGHLDDRQGLRDVNIFASPSWLSVQPMSFARWYPTNTALANGEILALAGTDEEGQEVETPEVWDGNSWRSLSSANRALPYYPRAFAAPNGLIFYAGELRETAYLDPAGTGRWIPAGQSRYGRRDYGSAVMYQPGKVMIVGGSDPPDGVPTRTAELIDLNAPTPQWEFTGSMRHARRQLNATVLPDGQVLVTGGTSSVGFSDPAGAVHEAELWAPATGEWTSLARNQVNRVYHSTSILLPDGRVLHAGSGDGPGLPRELNAELFTPPYLFKGARPAITAVPDRIGYGQSFVLTTPDAGQVLRVTLVRLGSVTHAFDQSQRFAELEFRRIAGGLAVRAPASSAVAPPGPYLLAILTGAGVPSVGRTVYVE
jgi:hypothetical protein